MHHVHNKLPAFLQRCTKQLTLASDCSKEKKIGKKMESLLYISVEQNIYNYVSSSEVELRIFARIFLK